MSWRKKKLCNISSGPGLHFALIVEDKNPNTLNLSFINKFVPYQDISLTSAYVVFITERKRFYFLTRDRDVYNHMYVFSTI